MRELTRSPELRVGEDHDLMNGTAREGSLRKEQLSRVPEEVGERATLLSGARAPQREVVTEDAWRLREPGGLTMAPRGWSGAGKEVRGKELFV